MESQEQTHFILSVTLLFPLKLKASVTVCLHTSEAGKFILFALNSHAADIEIYITLIQNSNGFQSQHSIVHANKHM
jgi:hypothetical protein